MFKFESEVLTEKQEAEIKKYWSYDPKDADVARVAYRVRQYIDTYLKRDEKNSTSGHPYNCCETGTSRYLRKDGKPITQDDIDTLLNYWIGQERKVTGNVGDAFVEYYYMCDSSG